MIETTPRPPRAGASLSARLLVLTVFFVMVAEFLIWAPSVARFRKAWLEDHIVRAHLAVAGKGNTDFRIRHTATRCSVSSMITRCTGGTSRAPRLAQLAPARWFSV